MAPVAAAGLVIGGFAGPSFVEAASNVVTLHGGNGAHVAQVSTSGQLITAAAPPGRLLTQAVHTGGAPGGFCDEPAEVINVPRGQTLVVTAATFLVSGATGPGLFGVGPCHGNTYVRDVAGAATNQSDDTIAESFPTGIRVGGPTKLTSIAYDAGSSATVMVYGYFIDN